MPAIAAHQYTRYKRADKNKKGKDKKRAKNKKG
jgi:hypothetical protein